MFTETNEMDKMKDEYKQCFEFVLRVNACLLVAACVNMTLQYSRWHLTEVMTIMAAPLLDVTA